MHLGRKETMQENLIKVDEGRLNIPEEYNSVSDIKRDLLTFLERTVRISPLSFSDGKSQNRRRSSLPGRNSAASSKSGRLFGWKIKRSTFTEKDTTKEYKMMQNKSSKKIMEGKMQDSVKTGRSWNDIVT